MWVERYKDTKTVDDLTGIGETRATSSKEVAEKGLHVSINTVRRRLAEAKVQYGPTRQKHLLSEVHMEKRLVWAT